MSRPHGQPDADRPEEGRDRACGSAGEGGRRGTERILIVSAQADRRAHLSRACRTEDAVCVMAESIGAGLDALGRGARSPAIRAVILDVPACTAAALRFVRELDERGIPAVLVCPSVSFDEAVEAMRAGAADIVSANIRIHDLSRRIRAAVAQRRAGGDAAPQIGSLARIGPASLEPADAGDGFEGSDGETEARGPEVVASVTPLEDGTSGEDAEFQRAVCGELDVETLLRSVLEFILAKLGPTNAAVFLPSTTGDYSLGAYVNYSCPKETAEVLLDHLANVAAPRLEQNEGIISMNTPASVERHLGESCGWIEDCQVVSFTCREQGECLAVFMLFRERGKPIEDRHMDTLAMISRRFAGQLARVIRIHHRHLPRDKWGALGDPRDTGLDEPGEGPMAA